MNQSLSPKQQSILDFLHDFLDRRGYPPSIRDIANACGISSTSVVDYNLNILERKGYIRRDPDISRGIELLDDERMQRNVTKLPVIGQIAAGEPIPVPTAETWRTTDFAETLEVGKELIRAKEDVYALKVRGTSMIDALIDDGDIVLMQHTNTAENGDMVAVWLKAEQETTLKKFYQEGDRARLQPANSQMDPIYVNLDNVDIQGRVIGVIRRMD